MDDSEAPYYTVAFESDGREKQTTEGHLSHAPKQQLQPQAPPVPNPAVAVASAAAAMAADVEYPNIAYPKLSRLTLARFAHLSSICVIPTYAFHRPAKSIPSTAFVPHPEATPPPAPESFKPPPPPVRTQAPPPTAPTPPTATSTPPIRPSVAPPRQGLPAAPPIRNEKAPNWQPTINHPSQHPSSGGGSRGNTGNQYGSTGSSNDPGLHAAIQASLKEKRSTDDHRTRLQRNLAAQGFVEKPVPGDNNCQFHALADQLAYSGWKGWQVSPATR